jgi:hypothetical protein
MHWLREQHDEALQTVLAENRAARLQHYGHGGRAAWIFARLGFKHRAGRPRYFSTAADCLERVCHGLLPFQRVLTLPVHKYATRRDPDAWIAARYARSVAAAGRHRRAVAIIDAVLARGPHGTYIEGHLRRRKALAQAVLGIGWRPELQLAEQLFAFELRTLEVASVRRTEAACLYLSGDPAAARQALAAADALNPHQGNQVRNRAIRAILGLPRPIGRLLLSAIYG